VLREPPLVCVCVVVGGGGGRGGGGGGGVRSSSYVVDRTEITGEVYPRYF